MQNHYADGRADRGRTREFFGCAACLLATVAITVVIVLMLVRSCIMPARAHPPVVPPSAPTLPLVP